MAYIVLDKIKSTAHYESVVNDETELKQGQFLTLGVLGEDGETAKATPATGNANADVFLVDAPVSYDDQHFKLDEYVVPAGKVGRAVHLEKGDMISVSPSLVNGAQVKDSVDVNTDGLGFKKATSGTGFGMVVAKETVGDYGDMFVIRIR